MQQQWLKMGVMGLGMGLLVSGLGLTRIIAQALPPQFNGPPMQQPMRKPNMQQPAQGPQNNQQRQGNSQHKTYQPNEAQDSTEGKAVLAAGAQRVDLSEFGSYGVVWFPKGFDKLSNRRVMFVIHGSNGNAYAGVYHQLAQAQKHKYGIIALQWWKGANNYMDSKMTEASLYKLYTKMAERYAINPNQLGLETFSRSAAQALETTYWNNQLGHPHYKLVVLQSGGVPPLNPMPLTQTLMSDNTVKNQFVGYKFFLYCGRKDEEWGEKMCEHVHNSEKIIKRQGGTVVRLIDDPNRGHGGMHQTPVYTDAETQAFLSATSK